MKLLLSSIACDPFGGSEGIYGWNIVSSLAKEFRCYVITHSSNQRNLENARTQGLVPDNISFRYLGKIQPYHPNRMIARFQSWLRYATFSRELLSVAREWHREVQFDLSQHVTYTTWRIASPLWELGLPFIWGPISGTEPFPWSCFSTLSLQSKVFELLRAGQSFLASISPKVRKCAKNAAIILVPHRQAEQFLINLRKSSTGVYVCHNFIFPDSRMNSLQRSSQRPQLVKPLTAFAAGNLEGRKGIAIALYALALARERGVIVHYRVTSAGPELRHLQKLARRLRLSDIVILGEHFAPHEYTNALKSFDLCLVPSLRDGAGLSIMEAMLAGCVPIVADWCGPAEFVTEAAGFKVSVTDPSTMAHSIADILCRLDSDRPLVSKLGVKAAETLRNNYNEKQFFSFLSNLIKELLPPKTKPRGEIE